MPVEKAGASHLSVADVHILQVSEPPLDGPTN